MKKKSVLSKVTAIEEAANSGQTHTTTTPKPKIEPVINNLPKEPEVVESVTVASKKEKNKMRENSKKHKSKSSPLTKIKTDTPEASNTNVKNEEIEEIHNSKKDSSSVFKTEDIAKEDPITDAYDEALDIEYSINAHKEAKREKRSKIVNKIVSIVLIFGCVYIIFLMYGLVNTQYIYDKNGQIVPQKRTIEQIRKEHEYNSMLSQYVQARTLYEEILRLDYRIAAGVEEQKLVAPEYEEVLEDVEKLLIQIQALDVSTNYSQVKAMLNQWVQTDVAVYCQRMSQAISLNNSEYAEQALEYRTIVYNNFSIITENMVTIGSGVEGMNLDTITNWSPEKFVQENLGAIS